MREDVFQKIMEGEVLAVLTDGSGKILWETKESPVAGLYHAYFGHKFAGMEYLVLYAGQAGIAMGILSGKIPVRECHAVKMSQGGLLVFNERDVNLTYEELIPLVKSSKDEHQVCPIEQFLYDHEDGPERWGFLEGRYKE